MSEKSLLLTQLQFSRGFTERLVEVLQTPEDWTRQVHPGSNHPLWIVGHIGTTDNFFLSLLAPDKFVKKDDYAEKFGMGSQPTPNPDDYPAPEEVLAFARDRRQTLLSVVEAMSEEDLDTKSPEGTPAFLGDCRSVLRVAAWHEGMHAGQLAVHRRALGHAPMSDRRPPTG